MLNRVLVRMWPLAILFALSCGEDENRSAVVRIVKTIEDEEAKCLVSVEDLSWSQTVLSKYSDELVMAERDKAYPFSTTGFTVELDYDYAADQALLFSITVGNEIAKQVVNTEQNILLSGTYNNRDTSFATTNQKAPKNDKGSYFGLPLTRSCNSHGNFEFSSGAYSTYIESGDGFHNWPNRKFKWHDAGKTLSLDAVWKDSRWKLTACNDQCYEWTADREGENLMSTLLREPDLYRAYQRQLGPQ